jgi:hypothetical protein
MLFRFLIASTSILSNPVATNNCKLGHVVSSVNPLIACFSSLDVSSFSFSFVSFPLVLGEPPKLFILSVSLITKLSDLFKSFESLAAKLPQLFTTSLLIVDADGTDIRAVAGSYLQISRR